MSAWLQFIVETLVEGIGFTIPIWIGLGIALTIRAVKKQQTLPKLPIVIGGFIVVMALIGTWLPRETSREGQSELTGNPESFAAPIPAKIRGNGSVQTVVSREPAGGATERDLNQQMLSKIEQRTLSMFRGNMVSELERSGKRLDPDRITASSVLIEVDGHKLAVTKLRADGIVLSAQIAGIVGDEFVRLACTTTEPTSFDILTGPCAEATKSAFGVVMVRPSNG